MTKPIFQDFPGPGNYTKNPGVSRSCGNPASRIQLFLQTTCPDQLHLGNTTCYGYIFKKNYLHFLMHSFSYFDFPDSTYDSFFSVLWHSSLGGWYDIPSVITCSDLFWKKGKKLIKVHHQNSECMCVYYTQT